MLTVNFSSAIISTSLDLHTFLEGMSKRTGGAVKLPNWDNDGQGGLNILLDVFVSGSQTLNKNIAWLFNRKNSISRSTASSFYTLINNAGILK